MHNRNKESLRLTLAVPFHEGNIDSDGVCDDEPYYDYLVDLHIKGNYHNTLHLRYGSKVNGYARREDPQLNVAIASQYDYVDQELASSYLQKHETERRRLFKLKAEVLKKII